MRQITAHEHGWLSVGGGDGLSQRNVENLAAAEPLLPRGCLQWGHRRVKFTQFCGVVQVDGLQVEVLPKLTTYQSEAQQRDILLTMLACTGKLEGIDTLGAGLATNRTFLLDLFIHHFARLLERQLQQGMPRDYRDIEENSEKVRGRIDWVRQQRENLFKPQRLACRYSELVSDVPINRLLHSALQLVIRLCTSPLLAQRLHALRMRFDGVGTLAHHEKGPGVEDLNRMQSRFAPLVALAHLFLDGQFPDARSGSHQAFSMLFNMNRLFERYATSRIHPVAWRHELKLVQQGPPHYLGTDENGRHRRRLQPDISLLGSERTPVAIFDAKWKRIEGPDALAAISAADLYQLATYASAYSCRSVTLLYPEQMHLGPGQRHSMTLAGTDASLAIIGLPIDRATDRSDLLPLDVIAHKP